MTELFEATLSEGCRTWRKNMTLGVPFLLNGIITLAVAVFGGMALVILLLVLMKLTGSLTAAIVTGILSLALVAVLLFVNAFFSAAAIGMASQATKTGKATLNDFFTYGMKKAVDLFLADAIVLSAVVLLAAVLLLVASAPLFAGSLNIALSIAAFDLALLLLLAKIMSFVLAPVYYAIMLSDLHAVDGIKTGYRFFMDNKLAVALLLFTIGGVFSAYNIITDTVNAMFGVIPLIGFIFQLGVSFLAGLFSVLVLQPITTLWWIRVYEDRAKKQAT